MYSAPLAESSAMRSPRFRPRLTSARATPFAIASSCAKLNSRGLGSPPRSMIAILLKSRSRRIRSPRLTNPVMGSGRLRRRRREISAAAAGDQLAVEIEDFRFGGRELRAGADDLAAGDEIARHRRAMIIDAHVDGRHAAPGLFHQREIGGESDKCGENAAMGVAAFDIDHPFLAPLRLDLDAVVADREHG